MSALEKRDCNTCGGEPDTRRPCCDLWRERAEAVEAENERLRVCGTCSHYKPDGDFIGICTALAPMPAHAERYLIPPDPCHFDPSRWTPYWADAEVEP